MAYPNDTSIEATYADGFILSETTQNDISLYEDGRNTFYDVLEKRPEAEHGKLVRFSCFYKDERHDVDWTTLPDNARPIRWRTGQSTLNPATGEQTFAWLGIGFGYQYTTDDGKNIKEIKEL